MEIALVAIYLLIVVAVIATLGNEGMWSNAIVLINIVMAALLATNFWEPLAGYLRKYAEGGVYVLDIAVLWGLFAFVYLIFRTLTDTVSRARVRFPNLVDQIGGFVFAGWAGWVLVCFFAMTLHTAPLSRNFLFGSFKPETRMMFGLAPDRQWLGFVQKMSLGPYSRLASADDPESHVFDRQGDFMIKYATRRTIMQKGIKVWLSGKPGG